MDTNQTYSSNMSLLLNASDSEDHHQHSFTTAEYAAYLAKQPSYAIAFCLVLLVLSSNAMSLAAIFSIRGHLSSHFKFLVSLACSDILVAVTILLAFINTVVAPRSDTLGYGDRNLRLNWCSFVIIKALNTTGHLVTLFSMMGMSCDAYIAILKPSYYLSPVNNSRSTILIIVLWLVAFLCGYSDFIVSIYPYVDKTMYKKYNFCEFTHISRMQEEYTIFASIIVCLVTMTCLYCRIYARVRATQRPGASVAAPRSRSRNGVNRERRVLITTVIILLAFIICFVPTCALSITMIVISLLSKPISAQTARTILNLERHLVNFFLLNGVIDPIIYTVRIPEVQQAYKRFLCGWRTRQASVRLENSLGMSRSHPPEEQTNLMSTKT